jgi:hypothetical protein
MKLDLNTGRLGSGRASGATDRYGGNTMKKVLGFLVAVALFTAGAAFAQAGTTTDTTNVNVRLRGILELQVDITDIEFDFTQNAVTGTIDGNNVASIDAFTAFIDAGGTEIFAPSDFVGRTDIDPDPIGTAYNDFGIARVQAAANPQWDLSAQLSGAFDDDLGGTAYGTLMLKTTGEREKPTATYSYNAAYTAVSIGVDGLIASARQSAPANAGANGISEVGLYFGFELDNAALPTLDNAADTTDDEVVTYTLVLVP